MLKAFFLLLVGGIAAFVGAQDIQVANTVTKTLEGYDHNQCIPLADPQNIYLKFNQFSECYLYTNKDCQSLKPSSYFQSPSGRPQFQPANTITGDNEPNTFFRCD